MKYTNGLLGLFGVKEEEKPTPKKKPILKKTVPRKNQKRKLWAKKTTTKK